MPDGSIVNDFKVNKNTVMSELVVGPVDYVDYVLRPYWDVRLCLAEPAPGSVFGITVFFGLILAKLFHTATWLLVESAILIALIPLQHLQIQTY